MVSYLIKTATDTNWHEFFSQILSTYEPGVFEWGQPVGQDTLVLWLNNQPLTAKKFYADLLSHANGISWFHGLYELYGIKQVTQVSSATQDSSLDGWLLIGTHATGEYWLDPSGRVHGFFSLKQDRLLLASGLLEFCRILLDQEALVFDSAGEYKAVFDKQGEFLAKIQERRVKVTKQHDPKSPWGLYQEAQSLFLVRDNEGAVSCLKEAILLDDKSSLLFEELAIVYERMELFKEAFTAYKNAAATSLSEEQKHLRLNHALNLPLDGERQQEAIKIAEEFPSYVPFLIEKAKQARKGGDVEKTSSYLELLELTLDPSLDKAHVEQSKNLILEIKQFLRQKNKFSVL